MVPFATLPRQGEVDGDCQTEGEVRDNLCCVSSPSVTFGATSPWRGRIEVVQTKEKAAALVWGCGLFDVY